MARVQGEAVTAIAITIFVLGCTMTVAWRMRDRARTDERRAAWYHVALFVMVLQVEAMKARDRAKGRTRSRP